MDSKKRNALINIIKQEKESLSRVELEVLRGLRETMIKNPGGFEMISDDEYALLNAQERSEGGNKVRIKYILSREIEFLTATGRIPVPLLQALKAGKLKQLGEGLFWGSVSLIAYYIEHKEQIDELVIGLLDGVLHRTEVAKVGGNLGQEDVASLFLTHQDAFIQLSSSGVEVVSPEFATEALASL